LKDFKLPLTINKEHTKTLLNISSSDKPPEHMYI